MMKKFLLSAAVLISWSANVHALTPQDMITYKAEYSDFWSDFAVKAYSCINDFDATLEIIKFDGALNGLPRITDLNPPLDTLSEISNAKRLVDTLIVSEGIGTEISSIAGRSIIGVSEDTGSHFSVGQYRLLPERPNFRENYNAPEWAEVARFIKIGNLTFSGVVLDKQTGQLQARTIDNQASPGQRPEYDFNFYDFDCKTVEEDELKDFTKQAMLKLLQSIETVHASHLEAATKRMQAREFSNTSRQRNETKPEETPKRRLPSKN